MNAECRTRPDCDCKHCEDVRAHAYKKLYGSMLANARIYLKDNANSINLLRNPEAVPLNAFEITAALSVLICKSKEDVMSDLLNLTL